MAGIYVHIPFCKLKCHYCDFYKTTDTDLKQSFLEALLTEAEKRKSYLVPEQSIETLYFGGGTPSVLSITDLKKIFKVIDKNYNISSEPEITMEVNPDDITDAYLKGLKDTGVNRLSIGIQSFDDEILKMLNRRHNSKQARNSIGLARKAGFDNLSADLIYGIPGQKSENWRKDLEKLLNFKVEHISAYHLTIEKNTMFGKMKELGELKETQEEVSEDQFEILSTILEEKGYIHYEISNASREGYFSRHNTNYWKQVSYLGLGPSAHSYNGYSREWNLPDINQYIEKLARGESYSEVEMLDEKTLYNEYVMTSLRTMWGVDLNYMETTFNKELHDYLLNMSVRFIKYGMLNRTDNNSLILTKQGKMISDNVISELMMV